MLNKFHLSGLLVILSLIILHLLNTFSSHSFKLETSVWCVKASNQSKICKFRNICYDPQVRSFLFFLGKQTVIKGFNHYSELQKIQLSSVQSHNHFYANLSVIDIENFKITKQIEILPKSFLFSRFKPNNLMHSIHDDLFPLFLTLDYVCFGDTQCMESYSLIFHDNFPKGPFFFLYNLFSKHTPLSLSDLTADINILSCFTEMVTGLITDGIFYQYGFKRPHGPVKPVQITQNDISRFTSFIKNGLKMHNEQSCHVKIVLLSREKSRKILNIVAVKKMIENVYKTAEVKLVALDLYSNDLVSLIQVISEADGLIGMHGAEMILSLFLKPNSFVIEIFPFGIKPDVVSFIKPISELENSNFVYFYWRNMLKNNSIGHPDAHPLFGGINNLDDVTQNKILNTVEVPPVQCCNNPLFLYHMYQDTWISNDFEHFLYKILSNFSVKPETKEIMQNWFFPDRISNISCKFQTSFLQIKWHPPFNIKNTSDLGYSLFIQDQKGLYQKSVLTKETFFKEEIPIEVPTKFEVWIFVFLNHNGFRSSDVYIKCN